MVTRLLALLFVPLLAAVAEECEFFFQVEGGETKSVVFRRRPLGMDFNKELGLVVKKVYGHAEELGVQPSWRVVSAGGEDLQGLSYKEGLGIIKEKSRGLPDGPAEAPLAEFVEEPAEPAEPVDMGTVLPEGVQDKLAGMFGQMEGLDAQTKALLGALLPKTGLAAEAAEELKEQKEHEGTDDLEGLMAALGGRLSGAMARADAGLEDVVDLDGIPGLDVADAASDAVEKRMEKLRQDREAHEQRMEKMRQEREERRKRREEETQRDRQQREEERLARAEEKKKRDEEWAEGRRKHQDYMDKAQARREQQKARREEMERKREEREARMEDVLRQAAEEMSTLKRAGVDAETLDLLKEAQKAAKSEL